MIHLTSRFLTVLFVALAIIVLTGFGWQQQLTKTQTITNTLVYQATAVHSLIQILTKTTTVTTPAGSVDTMTKFSEASSNLQESILWHAYNWTRVDTLVVFLRVTGTEPVTIQSILVDGVAKAYYFDNQCQQLAGQLRPQYSCSLYVWFDKLPTVGSVHTIGLVYTTPAKNEGFYGFNAVAGQES
jgi:hypothetical protein